MDTCSKYINKQVQSMKALELLIAECNYEITKCVIKLLKNKKPTQWHFNKIFKCYNYIYQHTATHTSEQDSKEVLEYLDDITKQLLESDMSAKDIAMCIATNSELQQPYTLIQQIAMIRAIASKI